ncbi:MAG: VOC family protein [Chloroflexota bacterium]
MIIKLHHAQITIPIGMEDVARQFYCNRLGLKEIEKPPALQGRGGFWLQLGSQEIHIGTEDGIERTMTKAHLAYHVSDLAFWREKLSQANVQMLESVPIPGYDRFEFRDPFGNRMEMIQSL